MTGAVAVLLAWGALAPVQADEVEELVELHCLPCHGPRRARGGVDLEGAIAAPRADPGPWSRVLAQLDARAMPPAVHAADGTLIGGAGLDAEDRAEFEAAVLALLVPDPADPGRPTLRRLTRSQLGRVLDDVFGVRPPLARLLPRDASGDGFDTTGDTLFMGPEELERHVELSEVIAELVLAGGPGPARELVHAGSTEEFEARLAALGARAFRRPLTPEELADRVGLVDAALGAGASPARARFEALRSLLLSPHFLFRIEQDRADAEGPWRLPGDELATRLSFFLWGTVPDAALSEAAEGGELGMNEGVRAQALRMLQDPRARWLAEDFAVQWLGAADLADVTPDVRRFRGFNDGLRRDMRAEVECFFADLVTANRSVLECLDSDFAFLNGRLAKHYGVDGVQGNEIRRVELPGAERRRGGVLGMGAFLVTTSTPLRTSPVQRGQWVLDRLLASPAPPAPPGAGALPEVRPGKKDGETAMGLRERLAAHRRDPSCASCHDRMDPVGLALEEFDGIGRRRSPEALAGIDLGVTMGTGARVVGVPGLKAELLADPERFALAFTRHLFTYAVGRPPGLADRSHLRRVVTDAAPAGYRVRDLVLGVCTLPAMTHRRLPTDADRLPAAERSR